tara:strand:+ start:285 stop:527 length:243 start_codon:yes stop_codon:yes gene_type:complete
MSGCQKYWIFSEICIIKERFTLHARIPQWNSRTVPPVFWATGVSSVSGLRNHPRISFKHLAVMGEPKAGVFVTHSGSFMA